MSGTSGAPKKDFRKKRGRPENPSRAKQRQGRPEREQAEKPQPFAPRQQTRHFADARERTANKSSAVRSSSDLRRSDKPRPDKAAPFKPRDKKFAQPATSPRPARQDGAPSASYAAKSFPRSGTMLFGLHPVREAWLNPKRVCHALWLTDSSRKEFQDTLDEARRLGLKRPAPTIVERSDIDQMLTGSVHQGVALDAAPLPDVDLDNLIQRAPSVVILLDQVTDPHNVGAILRSAAAFGAGGVVLTARNAPGTTGVLAKSASGALEHVPLVTVVNLSRALDSLKQAGYWCVGLAEEGQHSLAERDLSGKTALVLGAEGEGLRRLTRERCDELACLPTQPPIGSLNVSNAAAVALYEVRRQQNWPHLSRSGS